MATSVIGGRLARVNDHSTVREWSVSISSELVPLIASNTIHAPIRLTGNSDWTGSFSAYGEPLAAIFPGQTFTFEGAFDSPIGAGNATLGAYTGANGAIVDSLEITFDIASGGAISYVVNFSAAGALTLGDVSALTIAADGSNPSMFPNTGSKFMWEEAVTTIAPGFETLCDITTMTLTFTADNPTYVGSCDAGVTKRVAGNIDCNASISFLADNFLDSTIPQVNSILRAKFYQDASTFYAVNFMRVSGLSDITANRETGAPIGATLNLEFSGFVLDEDGTTWKAGTIATPGGTDDLWDATPA